MGGCEKPLVVIVGDGAYAPLLGDMYAVRCMNDHGEAVAMALEQSPALIIVDASSSDSDEKSIIYELRTHEALADVPILAMSDSSNPDISARLLAMGAQEVVRRPWVPSEISSRVAGLIDIHRMRRVLRTNNAVVNFAGHQLRTPLSVLLLQIHLLEQACAGVRVPSVDEGLLRVRRSGHRIAQLIDTLLAWTRVASGRFSAHPEECELKELICQIAGDFSDDARNGDHPMNVRGTACTVSTDKAMVRLVLANMLEQAIAAQPDDSVTVDIETSVQLARVAVRMSNEPWSVEQRAVAFGSSERNLRTGGASSSGLDLYVLRELARALGGDLTVENDADQAYLLFTLTRSTTAQQLARTR